MVSGTAAGRCHGATSQLVIVGGLAFCGPGIFNALNGLGSAGSDDPLVGAMANSCLYGTFAVSGYFGGAAFSLLGPKPLFALGGLTYAVYAVCIYFTPRMHFLAAVGGVCLGVGAGLFWAAQGALMMAYATPQSRGRLIALFWILFNLGGVTGGLLQFGLNFHNATGTASPQSYFSFVVLMLAGALLSPFLLADPSQVVREDGSRVAFEKPKSPREEVAAALQAIHDPFVRRCLLFFLASNWFYTYDFSGFNGMQFNMRTRGLNSALFWTAQMLAAWLFGGVLDAQSPPSRRAWIGMAIVAHAMALSLGLALWVNLRFPCGGGRGWDKGRPCELDVLADAPGAYLPMAVFVLLGAADALYQNYAYWLMSTAAGDDVSKTVMYSAVYKGVQSLGAGLAWLCDIPSSFTYRRQCLLALLLTVGACGPVIPTFRSLGADKKGSSYDDEEPDSDSGDSGGDCGQRTRELQHRSTSARLSDAVKSPAAAQLGAATSPPAAASHAQRSRPE